MVRLLSVRQRVSGTSYLSLYKRLKRRFCATQWHHTFKPSYLHNPGTEPLTAITTGQLVDIASERWAQREALVSVHQGHRLTFQQVKEQGDRIAAGLLGIGLKPGDRVGIWGPNSSQWYLTFIAAARAGLILVNINPAYQTSELQYCLTKAEVKALIASETFKTQKYHEMVKSIAPELESSEPGQLHSDQLPDLTSLIIISDNKLPGAYRFNDMIDGATTELLSHVQDLQTQIQPDDGFNLQFTSGTTGEPKATLLSHHNTINNMINFGKRMKLSSKEHRICLQVPLFHCFGNVLGVTAALICGATVVLPGPSFKAEESLNAIQKERCTLIYGTPTMFIDILSRINDLSIQPDSLELALISGAPVSKELAEKLKETFKLRRTYSCYGMTETSPASFLSLASDTQDKVVSTVGYIMDHTEVKVVDNTGKMVPIGMPGELWVRGYNTMLCYWDDETKTMETIGLDRWLKTGDQFVLQEDGYGQVVGRIKDMIIRGGENIFPREIEHFLEKHPEILEAQVIGIPDERMGEEVCACVRLVEGSNFTAEQIMTYCKGKIAHFKIPRHIKFVNEFPKTVSGKIQKFQLRNMVLRQESMQSG